MKVAHLSEPAEERVIFRDGLGVREWRDTGAGERVEWFHLDPCFAGVEMPLRDRVTRLAKLQHVKFARILSMEAARKGAGPVIVSSHVPGTRFSEVLEMATHGLVTVEPATAVQITREVIGALVILHDSRNVTHGALAPERLVLTASGRVIVAEHALAAALDRLNLPRHQLWRDWRIATPPTPGPMRFDVRTDLAQLGLLALAALLGRPIDEDEYPHRLRGLLPLAQDKLARSPLGAIAGDLVAWLERLVPVESRRAFATVKQAQQAFEGFVSARATSMIIAPARVKGLMSAVAALSTTSSPAFSAASAADAMAPTGADALVFVTSAPSEVAPSTAAPAVSAAPVTADVDDIDIDALLRLEAELEGGEAPVSRPVVAAAVTPPAPVDDAVEVVPPSTLEALEHERADLERQFAALVAAVAPAPAVDDAPAVRLRPETPETVDAPLVDPLVLWSSMPAADLPETPRTHEQDRPSVDADDRDATTAPDVASVSAFAFEPLVVARPDVDAPAAALDHVPTEWWREALPWRDEPVAPLVDVNVDARVDDRPTEETIAAPEPAPALDAFAIDDASAVDVGSPADALMEDADAATDTIPLVSLDAPSDAAQQTAVADGDPPSWMVAEPIPAEATTVVADGLLVAQPDVDLDVARSAVPEDAADDPEVVTVAEADAAVEAASVAAETLTDVASARVDVLASLDDDASRGDEAQESLLGDRSVAIADVPEAADTEPCLVEAVGFDVADVVDVLSPLDEIAAWQAGAPVDDAPQADESSVCDEVLVTADSERDLVETVGLDAADAVDVLSPLDEMAAWPAEPVAEPPSLVDEPAPIADVPEATDAEPWLVEAISLDVADVVDVPSPVLETAAGPADAVAVPPALTALEPPAFALTPVAIALDEATVDGSEVVIDDAVDDGAVHSPLVLPTLFEPEDVETPMRHSLFGEFADLRLQVDQDEAPVGEDVPSLRPTFAFLQVDTTSPTAAASLLARSDDAVPVEPSTWRTAFATDAPIASPAASAPVEATPPADVRAVDVVEVVAEADAPLSTEVEAGLDADLPRDVAPVDWPTAMAESSAPDAAPAAAPEPPAVDPTPAKVVEVEPEPVPEVVIVDGGDDADAFDALTPEVPSTAADVVGLDGEPVVAAEAVEDAAPTRAPELGPSVASPATTSGRKKRRRGRRKKASVVVPPTSPSIVTEPARALDVAPALPDVAAAATPGPTAIPTEPPMVPVVEAIVADETPLGGRRSLLEREVPTWTPPADLGAVARAAASRAIHVPPPEPAVTDHDWSTETGPSLTVAAGESTPLSADLTATSPVTLAARPSRQAMPVPVEPPRAEDTIRAVGMPDLEELGLSSGRGALTSMADALGSSTQATRQPSEPRPAAVPHAPESRGGWNWRRLVAASVLIALFNGAAFAAWWWAQPGAHGTLVVQTAQPGVEVLLDGKVLGKTPFRDQVAPGRHKLTLRQGVSVREMPVEISLGVVTTQSVDWPAADASARGNLQVSSTPAGAEILIDGKSFGKAPQLLEELPAGNLEMTLRGDAGTVTVTATVIAGETTPFDVPIFAGWVIVDAPIELNVILRGARIGANTDGQILLSPGRHQLMAVNEALGFRKPFTVLIEPGEVRRVAVTVPPAPLQVQDEPGSEVFVDGERIGALPGTLRIPLGTHDVLVRRPDQTERRQTVTVRAGDTVSLN